MHTWYARVRIIVDVRGLAIETLPGLYLNRFAGRYERLLYTALCSLDGGRGTSAKGRRRYRSQLSDQNPILSRSRSSGAGVSVTLVLARIPHAFYTLHPERDKTKRSTPSLGRGDGAAVPLATPRCNRDRVKRPFVRFLRCCNVELFLKNRFPCRLQEFIIVLMQCWIVSRAELWDEVQFLASVWIKGD